MAEIRFNPLTNDWVMIASNRQDRPQMPKDWCPFCPGEGKKVPLSYEVHKYDNDFPALSQTPPKPDDVSGELFLTQDAYGKCEVILYSPQHETTLKELSVPHIQKLIQLWEERFKTLSSDPKVKYVFIFENRGDVVGVTMPHPHGQIYAYPFIPKKIQLEIDAFQEHREKHNACLFCDMVKAEQKDGRRIIFENDSFVVFLPFFSEYPFGIYIASKQCVRNIGELNDAQKKDLAKALKESAGTLDSLFDNNFPYMMCMYNAPVNQETNTDFHFHIAFFPPMRSADKQKFNASSETGAWAHCNTVAPEESAKMLRFSYEKFTSGMSELV